MKFYSENRGFTLIEVMVVVAIIGLLSSVVFVSYNKARQQSRDDVRKSDIEQLALIMRLYVEEYGAEIDCKNGVKIDGSTRPRVTIPDDGECKNWMKILDFIEDQMGSVPADPLGPGDSEHYYYFDAIHKECDDRAILFARELEAGETNKREVCDFSEDESLGNNGAMDGASTPWLRELPFLRQK